jgi:predicted ester cyclase
MSTTENQAIVLRLVDAYFNQKNETVWDELVHPDVVVHEVAATLRGAAEANAFYMNMLFRAFSDLYLSVDDVLAAGDEIVLRMTESGTMTGNLIDMRPTGKQFSIPVIQICRLVGGKVVEMWCSHDLGAQLRQLGLTQLPASVAIHSTILGRPLGAAFPAQLEVQGLEVDDGIIDVSVADDYAKYSYAKSESGVG